MEKQSAAGMAEENVNKEEVKKPEMLAQADVKALRTNISRLLNDLPKFGRTRELSLVQTALEKGRMWLGDVLRHIGSAYPYHSAVVSAIADSTTEGLGIDDFGFPEARAIVGKWHDEVAGWSLLHPPVTSAQDLDHFFLSEAISNAYKHLKEAKFHLGMAMSEKQQGEGFNNHFNAANKE